MGLSSRFSFAKEVSCRHQGARRRPLRRNRAGRAQSVDRALGRRVLRLRLARRSGVREAMRKLLACRECRALQKWLHREGERLGHYNTQHNRMSSLW